MTSLETRRLTAGDAVDEYVLDELLTAGRRQAEEIPLRWRDATISLPEVQAWVNELVSMAAERIRFGYPAIREGRSLLLIGTVGVGKTWNAWGAVRALSESGAMCRWRFLYAAEWFRNLEPSSGRDTAAEFTRAAEADLLVLDDIGACKTSPAREEALTLLVSMRNDWRRPTLFTTNCGAEKAAPGLSHYVGDRVASRLAEMCAPVLMTGPDLRRERS